MDLVLLGWLWRKVLSGRELGGPFRASWAWPILGFALSLGVVVFSMAVATFPGEWQEERLPSWPILPAMDELGNPTTEKDASGNPRKAFRDWVVTARKLSLHDWLFNAVPDGITRRRLPFSSTLVLPGLNVYEGLGIDDPEKAKWHDFVFRARGRDLRGAIFDFAILPKVDFEHADLQGASLFAAQLQGASLDSSQLQGASLKDSHLEGASLFGEQLQGTSLYYAHLQGAWLREAELQGASLQAATLDTTDLSGAFLWRTNVSGSNLPEPKAVRFSDPPDWRPSWKKDWRQYEAQPWDKAYQDLRKTIEALPPGRPREQALANIRRLDCASPDKTLGSCNPDPSLSPPQEAVDWRNALESAARINETDYATALAATLKTLVCSKDENAIYVVRGGGFQSRLGAAGDEGAKLIVFITNKDNKDCPVSALLTDADRAKLLQIKQQIEKAPKPAAAGPAYSP